MTFTAIERLLEQVKSHELRRDEAALVALHALPVPWAWEGCFGILSTGEVIYVDDTGIPASAEPMEKLHTLAYASHRYPELAPLLPQRPENALSCPQCHGEKTLNAKLGPSKSAAIFCGECNGLGWVPPK